MIITILALIIMEGFLSFDNAIVLAALVKHLEPCEQKKALSYGIAGAFIFRFLFLALFTAAFESPWIKAIGALYLFYLGISNLFFNKEEDNPEQAPKFPSSFWKVVLAVEMADIMLSMDSITAAAALSQNLWVVFLGGVIGIIMMRFAATVFVQILEVYPKLERSAYLLIMLVGAKLVLSEWLNFEEGWPMTGFWVLFGIALLSGIRPVGENNNV